MSMAKLEGGKFKGKSSAKRLKLNSTRFGRRRAEGQGRRLRRNAGHVRGAPPTEPPRLRLHLFSFNALSSSSDILIIQFTSVEACKIFSVYRCTFSRITYACRIQWARTAHFSRQAAYKRTGKKITYAQDYTNAENV
jgi:hypothetical protein